MDHHQGQQSLCQLRCIHVKASHLNRKQQQPDVKTYPEIELCYKCILEVN